MPIINVYVDDHTMRALKLFSKRDGRTVEYLAEGAVQEAVIKTPEWDETAENDT